MRFVSIKSPDQQAALSQHRARQLMIGQRTPLSNMIRGQIGEFGHIVSKGLHHIRAFAEQLKRGDGPDLPDVARDIIGSLCEQLLLLHRRIDLLEKKIFSVSRKDERVRLLMTIPGIGPVIASAIVAAVGAPEQFRSGRESAAWIGLTPINKSSGGKERLGRITKMGDRYLRRLLVAGMTSRVRAAQARPDRVEPWLASLLERKPVRLATVAMTNKTARVIWAVLTRSEPYKGAKPA
ncbi:MAG: IS110 family transposase [Rhodobacteraceae bacterium]|nr:IS110 family transposase [Paracoccaceae bacterium]